MTFSTMMVKDGLLYIKEYAKEPHWTHVIKLSELEMFNNYDNGGSVVFHIRAKGTDEIRMDVPKSESQAVFDALVNLMAGRKAATDSDQSSALPRYKQMMDESRDEKLDELKKWADELKKAIDKFRSAIDEVVDDKHDPKEP